MTRLAAIEKLLYYPTPRELIPTIASLFQARPYLTVLDPCAGEGDALASILDLWNKELSLQWGYKDDQTARGYAIELDAERFADVAARFKGHALHAAFEETSTSG